MLFLPLFTLLGSLALQQPKPTNLPEKESFQPKRQKTLGRVVTKAGKPWGGVHVHLLSFPVFDQPFLGKPDRLETKTDSRGRFRVFLIPGRRYLAWGIGGKGKKGMRATKVFDLAFARGPLRLQEREDEAQRYEFQIQGRERWKGDLVVVASLKGMKAIAKVIRPDGRGVYRTPLWPGGVLLRVFTKGGMQVGSMSFPVSGANKVVGRKPLPKVLGLGGGNMIQILKVAKALQKVANQGAKNASKKAKSQSKAPKAPKAPKVEKGNPQKKKEEKQGEASPLQGVPVLELDWFVPIQLKIRKKGERGKFKKGVSGVRLKMLAPDKMLGLFDWNQSPPIGETDEDGLALIALPVPPGKKGRLSRSWKVVAESSDYCYIFPNIYRSVEYSKDPGSKKVKDSSSFLTLNLFSRKGFSIKGRLLGKAGKPISGRPLLLYTSRPSSANGWSHGRDPLFVGKTGKDGSFHLKHLDPRSTQVVAVVLNEEERAHLGQGSSWMDPRAVFFFREDSKEKKDVVDLKDVSLESLHCLEIRVSFLDSSPASFSRVLIAETQMHPNGLIGMYYPLQGFSDRRGRFAILLPDCEATIGVIGRDQRTSVKRVRLNGKPGSSHEEVYTLGAGRVLRGTVVDSDGKPFPNATIYVNLYSSGRNQLGWIFSTFRQNNKSKSDAKGRFKLRVPAGGRVYVSARYKVGSRWFYSRGIQFQVEEDMDPEPLELQIPTEAPKNELKKASKKENKKK
jgi:hypothetical protein